jgi:transcription elongation factor GreA
VSDVQTVTWLTQEAYDRLQNELEDATGPARAAIVQRIEVARAEGDLKENGGYHAAKEDQGKLEARIRQITELLRTAKVGAAPDTGGKAAPGMVLEVRFEGESTVERFLIGSREDIGHSMEVYSAGSPLGLALAGHGAGESVTYQTPTGKPMTVEILSVEPYRGG